MAKPDYVSSAFWHDPTTVADRLMWAREHYKEDPTQPRDLADLMERAATTLQLVVPWWWRMVAAAEAVAILALVMFR